MSTAPRPTGSSSHHERAACAAPRAARTPHAAWARRWPRRRSGDRGAPVGLVGWQPKDNRRPGREAADPSHEPAIADAGEGRTQENKPEAGDGEQLEGDLQVLFMPQPDVRPQHPIDQRVHTERFQGIPLQQEDCRQAEWGAPRFGRDGKQGKPRGTHPARGRLGCAAIHRHALRHPPHATVTRGREPGKNPGRAREWWHQTMRCRISGPPCRKMVLSTPRPGPTP